MSVRSVRTYARSLALARRDDDGRSYIRSLARNSQGYGYALVSSGGGGTHTQQV